PDSTAGPVRDRIMTTPRPPPSIAPSQRPSSGAGSGPSPRPTWGSRGAPDESGVASDPSELGTIGSSNGQFTCTGPGSAPPDAAIARAPASRHVSESPRPTGTRGSRYARAWLPYSSTWSIVWFAPVPRSLGGRSAVSTTSGVRDRNASTTTGRSPGAAVTLVQAT